MSIDSLFERLVSAAELIAKNGETLKDLCLNQAEAKPAAKTKAKGKAKSKDKPAPAPEPEDDDLGDDLSEDQQITDDDLMDVLREIIRVKGKDIGKAALKKYDAGRVSEIPKDKAANFIVHCKALLDG